MQGEETANGKDTDKIVKLSMRESGSWKLKI